jgi:hypothetical protein
MATRGLAGMVAAGAAIVIVAALVLWPGAEQATREPTVGAAEQQQRLGVRGERVDTARREVAEVAEAAAPAIVLPGVRPEVTAVDERRRVEPQPPATVIPLSGAEVARNDVVQAARPKVQAAVDGALADRHDALKRACWTGGAAAASVPIEASYGADGKMVALSVSDDRAAPGLGSCVRAQAALVPAEIEAPGVGVTVQASLHMP